MKTRQRSNSKKYGPNIVRAWFDTVFQYVLGRLESERKYLERRNWSYRFYKGTLDYIASFGEDMPASARANLEQFAVFFPETPNLLEAHDCKVNELLAACSSLHEAIILDPRFQETFSSVEAESRTEFGVDFSSHFGAFSTRDDFAGVLAEHLVNNVGPLPSFYATARLWNRFRDRFATVMTSPSVEPAMLDVEKSGQELLAAADKLTDKLKATRLELSLEFDVPYATEISSAI